MKSNEFPMSLIESEKLMTELLEFAEMEKDKDKRREILLLSLEVKNHIANLKRKGHKPHNRA